uniref:Uncharacterized protein n=1 Tax=Buteo japonicus TaxID=224669 RepID=A0A8C0BUH8_9AVES
MFALLQRTSIVWAPDKTNFLWLALQILWDSNHHFILHRPMNKHQMVTTFSLITTLLL